ncbi:hypothetical protein MMC17_003300 [Xylographa soralifera]|nr:hypothetical protein [Xylographa soralifera]
MEVSDDLRPLTAQHDAIKECMGRLVLAPVDLTKPDVRVLDSGTGDGHWLSDLAASLPQSHSATFIGTDIKTANFPQGSEASNIIFKSQSIIQPWPVEWHNSFDLVHQRLVLGACGAFPHREAVTNLAGLLKPGGWIQMIEPDQVSGVNDGPAMHDFIELVSWVFVSMGGTVSYAAHIGEWLKDLGFTDVQERGIPLFLGAANPKKELIARTALSTAKAMEPLVAYAKSSMNPSPLSIDRLENLVPRLHEELLSKGGYYPLRVIWGRKPLADS